MFINTLNLGSARKLNAQFIKSVTYFKKVYWKCIINNMFHMTRKKTIRILLQIPTCKFTYTLIMIQFAKIRLQFVNELANSYHQ